jgi:uncharacterized protein YfdQ (DUF2303 family)
LGSGQFHEDATDAMKALCRNMEQVSRATGGTPKGQLVLTMKFKLDRSIMEIEPFPMAQKADFMGHRATYAPALSDPWKLWTSNHGKAMPQAEFAQFIEDNITDVIVPNFDDPKLKTFAELVGGKFAEPSDLLALSRGLSVNVDVNVRHAVTLNTGAISVQYDETHKDGAGAPINIPNLFTIAIPVFYGGELYRVAARLRYRLSGGKLLWSYLLVRADLVFDDAFNGIVAKVRSEADVPVYLGSPEA